MESRRLGCTHSHEPVTADCRPKLNLIEVLSVPIQNRKLLEVNYQTELVVLPVSDAH